MKKVIITALLLFFAAGINAQTFGSSGLDVKGIFITTTPVYETWLRIGNSQNVIIKFEQTPEGLNNAMQLARRMLYKNEIEMDQPYFYHSKKSSNIKDDNPEALHKSIQAGESKINLGWYASDGALLRLFLGENSYEIMVSNAYKIR